MRRFIFAIAIIFLSMFGASAVAWDRLTHFLAAPGDAMPAEKVVVIPPGIDVRGAIAILANEGLVAKPDWMTFYVDHFAKEIPIKPGEYSLSPSMAPIELLKKIGSGKVVTYTVTVPPGATALPAEIAGILADKQLGDRKELLERVRDPKFADELGVPSATLEGFLFPDVYELSRGHEARKLFEPLVARYRKTVTAGLLDNARKNEFTERDLITLASLIEKSKIAESEQRLYSAVLHNRMKANKPLDVDAALDYGLALDGLDRTRATKLDLKSSLWNLKERPGLPPGPICSPSLSAIVAASEPTDSPALYMVKRNDGTHVFCGDVECYKAALKEWGQPQK